MGSTVTHLQLESTLKQQAPAPLYLIVGEEDLLRDRALGILKAAVLGEGGDDFNHTMFYGDEASGAEIRNSVSEVPVFAERRLVVVKGAEKLSARDGEQLLDCVTTPITSTTLVFLSPKLDGRLKFSQALGRAAVVVDCGPLREVQLPAWIASAADAIGVKLEDGAIQELKDVCGESLYGLQRELEKLASYVPSARSATAADVHMLRGMDPGASVFDLTLAIAEGRQGRVLSILARNLEAGEAPLRILGSLAWQYRGLWKAKELVMQGGRDGDAARSLRMDPGKVRAFLNRFSERHLRMALNLFLEADGKLKGGSASSPRMVLEHVLLHLCQGMSSTPAPQTRPAPPSEKRGTTRVVSNVRTITSRNRTGR